MPSSDKKVGAHTPILEGEYIANGEDVWPGYRHRERTEQWHYHQSRAEHVASKIHEEDLDDDGWVVALCVAIVFMIAFFFSYILK